jgi:hypothetical protein
MLNFGAKRDAVASLRQCVGAYNELVPKVTSEATALHQLRAATSQELIRSVEDYVSRLANSPKEFDKTVGEFKLAYQRFDGVVAEVELANQRATVQGGVGVGASVGLGAATAAAAPAAAMGIATTFGTASTGTAIAALSGAAQTHAALAWLGGGTLVMGGGGMAAGTKLLLFLGGPLGWGIGALLLTGTAAWTRYKNVQLARRARQQEAAVSAKLEALRAALSEIERLSALTTQHTTGCRAQLDWLRCEAPQDYAAFSPEAKRELGALINNIRSLSVLLHTQVA